LEFFVGRRTLAIGGCVEPDKERLLHTRPTQEADGVALWNPEDDERGLTAKDESMNAVQSAVVQSKNAPVRSHFCRFALIMVGAAMIFVAGCRTTQPHVTAKVIFQHDDVAAEVATEWR